MKEFIEEGTDVVEATDVDSKEVIPDYYENPLDVLERMFERYSEGEAKAPSTILHYASIASPPFIRSFSQ